MRILLVAALLVAAGCGQKTGILLRVERGAISTQTPVDGLEIHIARARCGRWVQSSSGTSSVVTAAIKDDLAAPYDLLVDASDPNEVLAIEAVAFSNGDLVGRGAWTGLTFQKDKIVALPRPLDAAPQELAAWYDSGDCFCHEGLPLLGADGQSCTAQLIPTTVPSQPNDICPQSLPAPPAMPSCDGAAQPFETEGRAEVCFAWANPDKTECSAGLRTCADHDAIAWNLPCAPTQLSAPTSLCQAWEDAGDCQDPAPPLFAAGAASLTIHVCSMSQGLAQVGSPFATDTSTLLALPVGPDVLLPSGDHVQVLLVRQATAQPTVPGQQVPMLRSGELWGFRVIDPKQRPLDQITFPLLVGDKPTLVTLNDVCGA